MKKTTSQSAFFNARLLTSSLFIATGVLLGIGALRAGSTFDRNAGVWAGRNSHATTSGGEKAVVSAVRNEQRRVGDRTGDHASDSQHLVAKWKPVAGAIGYRLDVSTDSSFNTYVGGTGIWMLATQWAPLSQD